MQNDSNEKVPVKKQKPSISENFTKIESEAAVAVMKHKDGQIEKRKL